MSKHVRSKPKSADQRLDLSVTRDFILDVADLIEESRDEPASDYLERHVLSKFVDPSVDEGADLRRQRAIEKWLVAEQTNEVTNGRIRNPGNDGNIIFGDVTVGSFFAKLREVTMRIIGPVPIKDLALCGFSGGATTSKTRRDGHPAIKFRDQAHATPSAWATFFDLIDEGCPWASHMASEWEYITVRGNVLFTVPKTSDIDRVACKEPDLNVFLQKGLGGQIRKSLRRAGVNLNDQSINGLLARDGSINGALATLDLSSASDSVTHALVERVLPIEWYCALNDVRSEMTKIGDVWHKNQMFSSMGNGFTFELESLLFYSICRVTQYFTGVKGIVSVYGDDLIVPVDIVDNLIEALLYCGFRVNPEKSFAEGPLRESCGKHWHNGTDITPFYLRAPFRRISDLILSLNQLAEWGALNTGVVDPRVERIHIKFREFIPKSLWGGQSTASRTALVTGHKPRSVLRYAEQPKLHDHVGGYLLWLQSTANRAGGTLPLRASQLRDLEIAQSKDLSRFSRTVSDSPEMLAFARIRPNLEDVNPRKPFFVGNNEA